MPRKTRRTTTQHSQKSRIRWPGLILTAVIACSLGCGGTYLALRPALAQHARADTLAGQAALASANHAFDQKQWPLAITEYTQAIADGLDTANLRTDLGTAYRYAGQPKKAIAQYQTAQKEDPTHENSLFNEAIVEAIDLNDSAKGIALWQAYLRRFPQGQHVADARRMIAMAQAHGSLPQASAKP